MNQKKLKRDEFLKIRCIVYRYWPKNPEEEDKDKSYVGTTPDEETRKSCWNKKNDRYAGKKLQEARQKYDPKSGWDYEVLEEASFDNDEDARNWMEQKEEYYIAKFNSRDHGFNSNKGGTGHKGGITEQHRANIKKNHSHYSPTQEQRENLSKKNKGRKCSPEVCAKISAGLKGKPKSEAAKQSMSACRKGQIPEAACKAAAEWRTKNESWWKTHQVSEETKEKQKQIQRDKNAKAVKVTEADGTIKVFETRTDAAKHFGVKPGCITSYIKTGKPTKNWSNTFEDITKEEYLRLLPFNPKS